MLRRSLTETGLMPSAGPQLPRPRLSPGGRTRFTARRPHRLRLAARPRAEITPLPGL